MGLMDLDGQGFDWVGPDLTLSPDKRKDPVPVPRSFQLSSGARERWTEFLNLTFSLGTPPHPTPFSRMSGHGAPLAPGRGRAGAQAAARLMGTAASPP